MVSFFLSKSFSFCNKTVLIQTKWVQCLKIVVHQRGSVIAVKFVKESSCGYWEQHDTLFSDRAVVLINNLKTQLDAATVKIDTLKTALDAIKIKRDNLKEKVNVMKTLTNFEVNKSRKLEDKVMKIKMFIMISCALFVGFIVSRLMN
ncbi:hypothetical protein HAX54_037342 [Datura stramonium]|uniref:Uncharacterized protein n=1 Tax=Datura stramonium TaxID=4076 RepID=A0ABS8RR10_DATST|nr:hypothetical protein [Datura stramonium]